MAWELKVAEGEAMVLLGAVKVERPERAITAVSFAYKAPDTDGVPQTWAVRMTSTNGVEFRGSLTNPAHERLDMRGTLFRKGKYKTWILHCEAVDDPESDLYVHLRSRRSKDG
jgi:hypothetical protein